MHRIQPLFNHRSVFLKVIRSQSSSAYIPHDEDPMPKNLKGKAQFWREPIYQGPFVSPLQRGPDYKIVDGFRPLATSKFEVERLQDQLELGKQIVQCLKEIKEAEELYEADEKVKTNILNEKTRWTPNAKGSEEIF